MGEVVLHDISKQFTLRVDGAMHTVRALTRVSFKVNDGEIVSLIGPSGCGKTTALRIAMGLETSSGGKVTVDGREVKGCGHDRGMVFQFAELLPWLTALQNVMFGLEMKGVRGAELRAPMPGACSACHWPPGRRTKKMAALALRSATRGR